MKHTNTAVKQIASMNFDELLAMKAKVEAEIDARIGKERQRLTASLQRLDSISRAANGGRPPVGSKHARRTVAPKYRNPENPKETWAGRGLKPRWLVNALKGGKKELSDFVIDR